MNKFLLAAALSSIILASMAPADERTSSLIKKLGSKDFRTREMAHKALLQKTDPDSMRQLVKALKSSDLEVTRRVSMIIRPYLAIQREKTLQGQMQKIREALKGKFPWISYSTGLDWSGQQTYRDKGKGQPGPPEWEDYRNATELFIYDLLQDGREREANEIIEALKGEEIRYVESYNLHNTPKLPFPPWK